MSTPVQHASPQNMVPNASLHPSSRRVLGDVTNSAGNTPRKHNAVAKDMAKAAPIGSPLKLNQTMTPAKNLPSKENAVQSPLKISRKRPFEDIDGAEDGADAQRRSQHRMLETSSASQSSFARPPIITIMPLPDDGLSTDEDEHSSVHPRANPEDVPDVQAVAEPICGSFSSLINYDSANNSDISARASLEPKEPEPVPTRAELLKLRLKVAMYKVKTDQTRVPFSSLVVPQLEQEAEGQEDPMSEDEDEILLEIKPSQRRSTKAAASITVADGPVSKLLSPPVLLPTAFSTRFITEPAAPLSPRSTASTSLPEGTDTPESSPTKGHGKRLAEGEKELTSSAVKGKAASGLIDLMKAG